MGSQIFKTWEPHKAIPRRVEVMAIRDEDEGLTVVLASEDSRRPVAKLVFQSVVAYRNVNESFRLRTWRTHNMAGLPSLLIVEGSLWLTWLRDESDSVLEEFAVTHYAIYTNDDCLDVAAKEPPKIYVNDLRAYVPVGDE
ncbi:MAG TPA: hypothetical protein VE093_33110 [Polyangiaceae bacterium]|jgi:hypothetical protein|nr:hypothetical protein [Polyangiaceae bacterium]